MKSIEEIFSKNEIIQKIKDKLPFLFQLAEIESSRAGKLGMEVGSVRERIIIGMLKYFLGDELVNTDIPITEAETDVIVFNQPISIKTVTGKSPNGIKLIWTVDPQKAFYFAENYKPTCDIILVQITWNAIGGLFFIPKKVQNEILQKLTTKEYIKLPKQGTNPRGVELSSKALKMMLLDSETRMIAINWQRKDMDHDIYKKWIDLWAS